MVNVLRRPCVCRIVRPSTLYGMALFGSDCSKISAKAFPAVSENSIKPFNNPPATVSPSGLAKNGEREEDSKIYNMQIKQKREMA